MNIISIVGPTAVGKSGIALQLAEKLLQEGLVSGVDVISADSRQVYKGLEIVSGADVPEELPLGIILHGVAMILPTAEWSLSHFHQMANSIIDDAEKNKHAVIVVGGTGLYQTQLLQSEVANQSPPQLEVREKALQMSAEQLQEWLAKFNALELESLNESDRANPRRLIRAIERQIWTQKNPVATTKPSRHRQHFFGLQTTKEGLIQRIQLRVEERLAHGAVEEVTRLAARLEEEGIALSKLPAATACGVREVLAYAQGDIDREQCAELWTRREVSYAKRQVTWWKKHPDVQWFDLQNENWQQEFVVAATTDFTADDSDESLL